MPAALHLIRPDRNSMNSGLRNPVAGLGGYGRYGGGMAAGALASRGGLGGLGGGRYADPYSGAGHHAGMGNLAGRRGMMHAPLQTGMLSPYNPVDNLMLQNSYMTLGRPGMGNLMSPGYGPYGGYNSLHGMNIFGGGACDGSCRGGCSYERGCDGSSLSSLKDVKTKDIMIRGKAYKVRKSFLTDLGKFEADIGKYLEKKSEETVPTNVVQMLIDFINVEQCEAQSLSDVVTLHVLGSNLSVKSVQEHCLGLLKKHEEGYRITGAELVGICSTIMLSSKVDDKLTEWLKKFLNRNEIWRELHYLPEYQRVTVTKPELEIELNRLLGFVPKDDNSEGLRIL
jgi:hypothetical protein